MQNSSNLLFHLIIDNAKSTSIHLPNSRHLQAVIVENLTMYSSGQLQRSCKTTSYEREKIVITYIDFANFHRSYMYHPYIHV